MAVVITQMEYIIVGAVLLSVISIAVYKTVYSMLGSYFTKHYFIFLDSEGRVKEIVKKTLRRNKDRFVYKKAEYIIDPTHRYHVLAYDEKNELRIRKDGVIDSMIRARTVEEYQLMAFSLLSRLLSAKMRTVDLVMLMLMGVVVVAVIYGLIHGQR
jgi:K+-sensing histidine kinase KdpD